MKRPARRNFPLTGSSCVLFFVSRFIPNSVGQTDANCRSRRTNDNNSSCDKFQDGVLRGAQSHTGAELGLALRYQITESAIEVQGERNGSVGGNWPVGNSQMFVSRGCAETLA